MKRVVPHTGDRSPARRTSLNGKARETSSANELKLRAEIKSLRAEVRGLRWDVKTLSDIMKIQQAELAEKEDPAESKRAHRGQLASLRAREVDRLAFELKQQGVANPISKARDMLAEKWGFQSGHSLHKWQRRNR